jgi:DNA-binding transcriptional ArsR family regulator
MFAAVGDRTRLEIVRKLADGGTRSITRISEGLGLSRQAITKHLRVLEDAGLIQGARKGRERHYALEPRRIDDLRIYLDHVSRRWDEAIERLEKHVEDRGSEPSSEARSYPPSQAR